MSLNTLKKVLNTDKDLKNSNGIQNAEYFDNLTNDVNFLICNKDMQKYAYEIAKNTDYSIKLDFDTLVALYRLKLCFSNPLYDSEGRIYDYKFNESMTVDLQYEGKKHTLNYFNLCKLLFHYEKKTIYKMNQFSASYIQNIKILDVENLEDSNNFPKYKFEIFNKFNSSKLLEFNSILPSQVEKLIDIGVLTENLTVVSIRLIIKTIKLKFPNSINFTKEDFIITEEEKEDKEENEEPEFFIDNENQYDLFDFKVYSKSKLVCIAYDCYLKYLECKKQIARMKSKKKGVI